MFDAKKLLDAMVAGSSQSTDEARQSGGLGGLLGQIAEQVGGATQNEAVNSDEEAGGLGGMLGNVLKQATGGLGDAASDVNAQTGIGDKLNDLVGQFSGGQDMDDLLEKAKGLVGDNQLATGAVLGGLGSLLLGTKTGRSLTGSAAKLGGLALIGGLAYRAYQNYSNGEELVASDDTPTAAPDGSGFEAAAQSDDDAKLFLRTMIAAAASDGEIDAEERTAILGGLDKAGLDGEATSFIAQEFSSPATIEDIAGSVDNEQTATQVYTAARVAIEPETEDEQAFLANLAAHLELDETLVAQIDQAANGVKA